MFHDRYIEIDRRIDAVHFAWNVKVDLFGVSMMDRWILKINGLTKWENLRDQIRFHYDLKLVRRNGEPVGALLPNDSIIRVVLVGHDVVERTLIANMSNKEIQYKIEMTLKPMLWGGVNGPSPCMGFNVLVRWVGISSKTVRHNRVKLH